jgi:hypothetical protein
MNELERRLSMNAIDIDSLCKTYNGKDFALRNLNMTIHSSL